MTTLPHPLATVPARSDRGLQRRRRLRLARTRLGLSVQTRLLPTVSASRRTRLHVCGAANTLTALGVRVEVRRPAVPWPRARVVVATDPIGPLGELAVATVLRGESIRRAADVPADATVCPLLVCYRLDGQAGYLDDDAVPRSPAEIAALRGLVVEVHLLSPTSVSAAAHRRSRGR